MKKAIIYSIILFLGFVAACQAGEAPSTEEFRTAASPQPVPSATTTPQPMPSATAPPANLQNPNYLGIEPPNGTPLLFRPGDVSTSAVELSMTVHPNLQEIYFTRIDAGKATIWFSQQTPQGWSVPAPAPFSGKYDDIAPFITADGQALYFSSKRPTEGGNEPQEQYQLWMAARDGDGWANPTELKLPLESICGEMHASLTLEGTLYYMANYPSLGGEGLFRTRLADGAYQTPEKIELLTNDGQVIEVEPYISPDERFLLFYSAGRADNLAPNRQLGDIYIAFQESDGGWSEPQNLGAPLNSPAEESTPSLTPDSRYIFFASNRATGRFPDIYCIDTATLELPLTAIAGSQDPTHLTEIFPLH